MTSPLTNDQAKNLLKEGAPELTAEQIVLMFRYLIQGQGDLEGKARQLKSTVSRLGR
jgi:hypothetical protein